MAPSVFPEGLNLSQMKRSERQVLDALVASLGPDVDVYCNIELTHNGSRRELDFTVVIPNYGIAIIEVKGGNIRTEYGVWEQFHGSKWHEIPVANQIDAEYRTLYKILQNAADDPSLVFPTVKMLCTPDVEFPATAHLPGMFRNRLIDKRDLDNVSTYLIDQLKTYDVRQRSTVEVDQANAEWIRSVLTGIQMDYAQFVKFAAERKSQVDLLTREQAFVIDALALNPRTHVIGGPGTGKTLLAQIKASTLTSKGLKVGVLCHNRGLASMLKFQCGAMSEFVRPVFVGNFFDDLAAWWGVDTSGVPKSADATKTFYHTTMPERFKKAIPHIDPDKKVDVWVVDEAQDFLKSQYEILQATLNDPENGEIHLFGDPEQDLYDFKSEIPWFTAKALLSLNVRSTTSIAVLINALKDLHTTQPAGVSRGFQPEFHVVASRAEVLPAAEAAVKNLIDDYTWPAHSICLLTSKNRHPIHDEKRKTDDNAYWADLHQPNDVFYSRINTFKGLEKPCVVVALDGSLPEAEQKQQMMVGASRARDEVVIVGTRQDLALIPNYDSVVTVIDHTADSV